MFNSLKHAKSLEEVGFTRQQAEVQVEMLTEFVTDNFATKQDLRDLRTELKSDMVLLENRLIIKLGTIVSVSLGVAVALARLV